LEAELENLDKCVNRETMVNIIHEITPSLIGKKGKGSSYLFKSFEESDSVKIIEIREKKTISHKQQRKVRPKKIKQFVV